MKIEIKSRWDSSKILLCGEYKSIKDCLEKNRQANLSNANLSYTNLFNAYLSYTDLSKADLSYANLSKADLSYADLSKADLFSADLSKAYLSNANLSGAKNYHQSHDFAMEIIKRQPIKHFTDKEWEFIGKCLLHRFCYDTIKDKYKEIALKVFKKLSKLGYDEYEKELRK